MYLVGAPEESAARSARKEERPELEDLVVLGKRLRWSSAFSAESDDEDSRKQEATDRRVEPSGLRCNERNGPGVATFLILGLQEKPLK